MIQGAKREEDRFRPYPCGHVSKCQSEEQHQMISSTPSGSDPKYQVGPRIVQLTSSSSDNCPFSVLLQVFGRSKECFVDVRDRSQTEIEGNQGYDSDTSGFNSELDVVHFSVWQWDMLLKSVIKVARDKLNAMKYRYAKLFPRVDKAFLNNVARTFLSREKDQDWSPQISLSVSSYPGVCRLRPQTVLPVSVIEQTHPI